MAPARMTHTNCATDAAFASIKRSNSHIYHKRCTPDSGHYRTMGMTASQKESSDIFYCELQRGFDEEATHPALHVQNGDTPIVLTCSIDVQEISRTWYIALFSRPPPWKAAV